MRLKLNPYGRAIWVDYEVPCSHSPPHEGTTCQKGVYLKQAHLKSTGKVILAAGALNTPRILLLSGIGPIADLNAYASLGFMNAPPVEFRLNAFVGVGLQDHVSDAYITY